MKIAPPPIRSRIARYIENVRYNREQKFLDKYVRIHDEINGDTYTKLDSARKTMANFAKNKGITIDIYDARRELQDDELVSCKLEDDFAKKLSVHVTDLLTGKRSWKLVNAKTDKSIVNSTNENIIPGNPMSGKNEFEDNFLRNLYRKVEEMVNQIQNNK